MGRFFELVSIREICRAHHCGFYKGNKESVIYRIVKRMCVFLLWLLKLLFKYLCILQ